MGRTTKTWEVVVMKDMRERGLTREMVLTGIDGVQAIRRENGSNEPLWAQEDDDDNDRDDESTACHSCVRHQRSARARRHGPGYCKGKTGQAGPGLTYKTFSPQKKPDCKRALTKHRSD